MGLPVLNCCNWPKDTSMSSGDYTCLGQAEIICTLVAPPTKPILVPGGERQEAGGQAA